MFIILLFYIIVDTMILLWLNNNQNKYELYRHLDKREVCGRKINVEISSSKGSRKRLVYFKVLQIKFQCVLYKHFLKFLILSSLIITFFIKTFFKKIFTLSKSYYGCKYNLVTPPPKTQFFIGKHKNKTIKSHKT